MDFQSEQKKFLQQHKTRSETYSKAAATMKKQRKKSRAANKSGLAMDKELKNMQILEEEKTKLDAFCEQSLKNVSKWRGDYKIIALYRKLKIKISPYYYRPKLVYCIYPLRIHKVFLVIQCFIILLFSST